MMDSVVCVSKESKDWIINKKKRNKINYSIVFVAIKEQENRLKRCVTVALNYLNKIVARSAEKNALT
jgi:hypothetical protein